MTFGAIYTASEVLDKISKIAAKKFGCNFDDIGQVWPKKKVIQNEKKKDETKEVLCFTVFDKSLEIIGTVYRSEVRKYANGKFKKN